jgi:pimeloyl-ACP methyl ester carboxylesterase
MTRYLLACVLTLGMAAGAAAQEKTTVFIHGLGSSPDTWDAAVDRLAPVLAIRPLKADLDWASSYESQAGEIDREIGSDVPRDALAVGHSNGGIVARQWARARDLDAIVTIGSPNQGAPLVDHIFEWLTFLDNILDRIANVENVFANEVNFEVWKWVPNEWKDSFARAVDIWDTAGHGLVSLGFDYRLPVMAEMRYGSAFMSGMNAGAARDREASEVPNRVAIVNVARDFYVGGPFRVIRPDSYQSWHNGMLTAGFTLEYLAALIRAIADVRDRPAFDLADQIGSVGDWLLQFEEVWCRSVSDVSPLNLGKCYEHDGLVPAWSQAYDYPRLPLIVRTDGPVHTDETTDSDDQLYEALTSIGHVLRRDALPPPVPDPEPDPTPDPTPNPTPDPPPVTPPAPPPTDPPPPGETTGRYKWNAGVCAWDPFDSGPDQCTPTPPPGRYKLDGHGACYWEPNDYPPDQCEPTAQPSGRFKLGANGCYWDENDEGPDQCVP